MIIKASEWLQMSDWQKIYLLAGIFFVQQQKKKEI
jgi:hypothetical protein